MVVIWVVVMVVTLGEAGKKVVSLRIYGLTCYHDECLCSCPSEGVQQDTLMQDLLYEGLLEELRALTDDGKVPPHRREDIDLYVVPSAQSRVDSTDVRWTSG